MTRDDCNDMPKELPMFSLLSPHHRMTLVADVLVGLIIPSEPLPPDTFEHSSTFYALYSYCLTQIEVECDTYGSEGCDGCETTLTVSAKPKAELAESVPKSSLSFMDEFEMKGNENAIAEKKQRRRLKKSMEALSLNGEVEEEEKEDSSDEEGKAKAFIEHNMNMFQKVSEPISPPDENADEYAFCPGSVGPCAFNCDDTSVWWNIYAQRMSSSGITFPDPGDHDLQPLSVQLIPYAV